MANAILNAINHGFTSRQVLIHISQRFPQYASAINTAQLAGYTTDKILKKLAKPEESSDDSEEYLTEHERTQRRDSQQKKKAALQVAGVLGTAGAVGAGAYAIAQRNRPIRPQVLPALPGQGPQAQGGPMRPRGGPQGGLPGGGQQGLPAPRQGLPAPQAQQQPSRGRQPSPAQPPIQLGGQKPEDQFPNVPEVKNLQRKGSEINQMWDLAQKGKTQGNPFLKTASKLQKAGTITDVVNFANFYNWWNATEGQERGGPLVEYEKFRVQTKGMFEPPAMNEEQEAEENLVQQLQSHQMEPQQAMQQPDMAPDEQMQQQPMSPPMSITERTQQAAFAEKPELKRLMDTTIRGKEFAVPTYQFPGESKEDFSNRRIINEAVKKAAGELKIGKSFLEQGKISSDVLGVGGLSTAEDVLRFMAGIPNVYDPLLDEDEKQELFDGLMETGQTSIEGLRPSEGERGVHGAPMTPNMVWNLLLTVEPRLYKMERPPAQKGSVKPGSRMDSTGFRRYLTHAVYGVLSGKKIGPDLSEKIAKISQATASCDVIAKAAEDGNFNKVLKEIERLSNDDSAFFELFDDEVENMVSQYGVKGMKIKGSASDTRSATELRKKLSKTEELPVGEYGD